MPGETTAADATARRQHLIRAFAQPREFTTSPLYRALGKTVATEDRLLDLAAQGRPGQYPTFLFFGAVHYLLLSGVQHPLAAYYPSVAGPDRDVAPATEAGPALIDFCEKYEQELAEMISTRLVQTSQVQRALALRIGLSVIARRVPGPVHLIEVGASAGLNLRFDRYGYTVGGEHYGNPASPVQLVAQRYGVAPLPDLDRLPGLASVAGVDLNPIDVLDPDARAWLKALVWPENHDQRALLAAALDVVAADPPRILRGDAIDVLPGLARTLPPGEPRVVFHSATRMHVPVDRLTAFDAAITSLGESGPLWWLSLEGGLDPSPGPTPVHDGAGLRLLTPDGQNHTLAVAEGHLRWVETVPLAGP